MNNLFKKCLQSFMVFLIVISSLPIISTYASELEDTKTSVGDGVNLYKNAKPVPGKLNQWEVDLRVEVAPAEKTTDIVFVYDKSSSMLRNSRHPQAQKAAIQFAKQLDNDNVRLSLVEFGTKATKTLGFTKDKQKFINSVNNIKVTSRATGGEEEYTFTSNALEEAEKLIKTSKADNKIIVFLSDGNPTISYKLKSGVANTLFNTGSKSVLVRRDDFPRDNYTRYYRVLKDPNRILNLNPNTAFTTDVHAINEWLHASTITNGDLLPNRSALMMQKKRLDILCNGVESEYSCLKDGKRWSEWDQTLQISEMTMLFAKGVKNNIKDTTIYSVGLDAGNEGQRVLDYIATSKNHSFEANPNSISSILEEIAGEIGMDIKNIEINDPMGEGFNLIGKPKVIKGNEKGLTYDKTQLKWNLNQNSYVYDKSIGKFVVHVSYIVESNEDAIALVNEGKTELETNGDASFTYEKEGKKKNPKFPKPSVKPSIISVSKELYDENDKQISLKDDSLQRKYQYIIGGSNKFNGELFEDDQKIYHIPENLGEFTIKEHTIINDSLDNFDISYTINTDGKVSDIKGDSFTIPHGSGMNHITIKNKINNNIQNNFELNKSVVDDNQNKFAEAKEALHYTVEIKENKGEMIRELHIQDSLDQILDFIVEKDDLNKVSLGFYRNDVLSEESYNLEDLKNGFNTHLMANEKITLKFTVNLVDSEDLPETLINEVIVNEKPAEAKIPSGKPIISSEKIVEDDNKNGYAEAGEYLEYTIRIKNDGQVSKTVKIQDDLKAIMPYIDPIDELEFTLDGNQRPLFDLVDGFAYKIEAKTSYDLKFKVKIKDNFDPFSVSTLENKAYVDDEEIKTNIPTGGAIIYAEKHVKDDNENKYAEAGELLHYTIDISNTGNLDKTIHIQDTLEDMINFIETIDEKDTFTLNDEVMNLEKLIQGFDYNIKANSKISINFSVKLKDNLDVDEIKNITNIASIDEEKPKVVIPTGKAEIKSSKTVIDDNENKFAEHGEKLHYNINIKNTGEVSKLIKVQDDLSDLINYIEPIENNKFTINDETRDIKELMEGFDLLVNPGANIDIKFTVQIKDDLNFSTIKEISNFATVDEDIPKVDIPTGEAIIKSSKEVEDDNRNGFAEPMEELHYTIKVENEGDVSKVIKIQDTLEDLIPHIDPLADTLFTLNEEEFPIQKLVDGFDYEIKAKEKLEIKFTVRVKEDLNIDEVKNLFNKALVDEEHPNTSIETAEARIISSKTVEDENGNGYAEVGESLTYTISVENTGRVDAVVDVKIQDKLDDLMDHIDPIDSAVYDLNGVEYPLSDLMKGIQIKAEAKQSYKIQFTVKLKDDFDPSKVESLLNVATIDDHNPKVEFPSGMPIIESEKIVEDDNGDGLAEAGETLNYKLIVKNTGQIEKDVFIKDDLRLIIDFLDQSNFTDSKSVTINSNGNTEFMSINTLINGITREIKPNEEHVFEFSLKLKDDFDADEVEELINIAEVDDLRPSSKISSGKAVIKAEKFVKDENNNGFAEAGEELKYQINISNSGTVAKKVKVQDNLENLIDHIDNANFSKENTVTVINNGEISYRSINELINGFDLNIQADNNVEIHFTLKIKDSFDSDKTKELVNIASIDEEKPSVPIPSGKAKITVQKDVVDENNNKFAEAGERLDYTITIRNSGEVGKVIKVQDDLKELMAHIDPISREKVKYKDQIRPLQDLVDGFDLEVAAQEVIELSFSVKLKDDLDVDAVKNITNVALVDGHTPKVEIPSGKPRLVASKDVRDENGNGFAEAKEKLTYQIKIINLGEVEKTINIKDDLNNIKEFMQDFDKSMMKVNDMERPLKELIDGFEYTIKPKEEVLIEFDLRLKEILDENLVQLINLAHVDEETPKVEIPVGRPHIYSKKEVVDENENGFAEAGEILSYKITFGNSGNVSKIVHVQDDLKDLIEHIDSIEGSKMFINGLEKDLEELLNGFDLEVLAGQEYIINFDVKIKEDFDADKHPTISNIASIDEDKPKVELPSGKPKISAKKLVEDANGNGIAEPGETLNYQIAIENTGSVSKDIFIKDDLSELIDHVETIETFTMNEEERSINELINGFTHTIKANEKLIISFNLMVKEDLNTDEIKELTNIAVVDEEKPSITIPSGKPEITAIKSVQDENNDGYAEAGEILYYTISIKNSGKVSKEILIKDDLANLIDHIDSIDNELVSINDDEFFLKELLDGIVYEIGPNQRLDVNFKVRLKDDFDSDSVDTISNLALVDNEKPFVEIPSGKAEIIAVKSVEDDNKNGFAEAGEKLHYTIGIKNTGEVSKTIYIQDDLELLLNHIESIDNTKAMLNDEEILLSELVDGFDYTIKADEAVEIKFTVQLKEEFDASQNPFITNIANIDEEEPKVSIPSGQAKIIAKKEVFDENDNGFAELEEKLKYVITIENIGEVSKEIYIQDNLEELIDYIETDSLDNKNSLSIIRNGNVHYGSIKDLMTGIETEIQANEKIQLVFELKIKNDLNLDKIKEIENIAKVDELVPSTKIPTGKAQIISHKSVKDENKDGFAQAGEKLTYTIRVSNTGQVSKTVFVKDDLSSLLEHVKDIKNTQFKLNNQEFKIQKLINGFELEIAAGESIEIIFDLILKDDFDASVHKSLLNVAEVDEDKPKVEIPSKISREPFETPSTSEKDPILPQTGMANTVMFVSGSLIILGFVLLMVGTKYE